jgi:ATP-dependent Lhr-like helicase
LAQQLLLRYGVLTREAAASENIPGGFSVLYPALKTMEESGRIRRGMFVAGVGATQFAMPAALDLLRALKDEPDVPDVVHLAATDPANPYGALLKWPTMTPNESGAGKSLEDYAVPLLSRSIGASVLLVNGALAAYLRRRNPDVLVFLPADEPARGVTARAVAGRLADLILQGQSGRGSLIAKINGRAAAEHALAPFLEDAGFVLTPMGFHLRRRPKDTSSEIGHADLAAARRPHA